MLITGAREMLPAQQGRASPLISTPPSQGVPSGPCGLHAMLFLASERGCWGGSPLVPFSHRPVMHSTLLMEACPGQTLGQVMGTQD